MSNRPVISIIVPVYNVEKYLNRCVESIANQTHQELEILLVDDGSSDHSPEICDAWAKKDHRIQVIHKPNGGVSSARNAGLDSTKGDYIAFVDGDDYIDLDMYEIMLREIVENGADAARCAIVRESSNGYKEEWGNKDSLLTTVNKKQLRCDIGEAYGILPVSPCNKLFKAECIADIRFNTEFRYSEDTLFNFQVAQNINKMVYHDVCRYHYVNNSDSASHRKFEAARFDEHKVMDIIFNEAEADVLPYCIKGDVIKSFRTIKQMIAGDSFVEYYGDIRQRIIKHRKSIFRSGLYSKSTKLKTLLLWLAPDLYRFLIGIYGRKAEKEYNKLTTEQ